MHTFVNIPRTRRYIKVKQRKPAARTAAIRVESLVPPRGPTRFLDGRNRLETQRNSATPSRISSVISPVCPARGTRLMRDAPGCETDIRVGGHRRPGAREGQHSRENTKKETTLKLGRACLGRSGDAVRPPSAVDGPYQSMSACTQYIRRNMGYSVRVTLAFQGKLTEMASLKRRVYVCRTRHRFQLLCGQSLAARGEIISFVGPEKREYARLVSFACRSRGRVCVHNHDYFSPPRPRCVTPTRSGPSQGR